MAAASEASATHLPMAMDGDAPQLSKAVALMQEIQTLGRLPKHVKGTSEAQTAERNLAKRLNKARAAGRLTAEHEAELTAMDGDAPQLAEAVALMQEIQTFGRVPKQVSGKSEAQTAERNLAKRLAKARASIYRSIYLFIYISINLSIYLYIYLSMY